MTTGPNPRIFGYGRASTDKQENSPETQRDLIRRYIRERGLGELAAMFIDAAVSGKIPISDRKSGGQLMTTLRRGDILVITRIDRAFRSTADCALQVDAMVRMGVRLHIIDFAGDAVDVGTPQGRLFVHMMAAFAEFERELNSIRTKEGIAAKRRNGQRHSRFAGYGFKWGWGKDAHGRRVKVRARDDEERTAMQSIVKWKLEGWTIAEIAHHLNEHLKLATKHGKPWSVDRVNRCLIAEMKLQVQEREDKKF